MNRAMLTRNMPTERAASDQASQEAARVRIPLTPCSICLVSSSTTLLYSSTVSGALRQALRNRTFYCLLSVIYDPSILGGGDLTVMVRFSRLPRLLRERIADRRVEFGTSQHYRCGEVEVDE